MASGPWPDETNCLLAISARGQFISTHSFTRAMMPIPGIHTTLGPYNGTTWTTPSFSLLPTPTTSAPLVVLGFFPANCPQPHLAFASLPCRPSAVGLRPDVGIGYWLLHPFLRSPRTFGHFTSRAVHLPTHCSLLSRCTR